MPGPKRKEEIPYKGRLITRAEAAKIAGISEAGITRRIKKFGLVEKVVTMVTDNSNHSSYAKRPKSHPWKGGYK